MTPRFISDERRHQREVDLDLAADAIVGVLNTGLFLVFLVGLYVIVRATFHGAVALTAWLVTQGITP